jgi:hypothetical protein
MVPLLVALTQCVVVCESHSVTTWASEGTRVRAGHAGCAYQSLSVCWSAPVYAGCM